MPQEVPLHPVLVHLPLALAFLMPLLAAGSLLAWWRGWLPGRRLWVAVVLLQAILVAGAVAAQRTGETEEERVEPVVGEAVVEPHEEAADLFVAGAVAVLVLAGLAASIPREGTRRLLALLTLAGMLVVTILAYRTGKAGGEMVYLHGAAAVYAADSGGGAGADLTP